MPKYFKIILFCLSIIVIGFSAFKSLAIYKQQMQINQLKEDFAEYNKINYGLFNMQAWKDKAFYVFSTHIENFKVSPKAFSTAENELRKYLYSVYDKYIASGELFNNVFDDADKNSKINKVFLKLLKDNIKTQVDALKIKDHIPDMAHQLAIELKKQEPQFRAIMQGELKNLLQYQDKYSYVDPRVDWFKKFNCSDITCTNDLINKNINLMQEKQKNDIKLVFGLMLGLVILLSVLIKLIEVKLWVLLVTMVSILLLVLGIHLPMIILDARLNSFSFNLFETDLKFTEQVVFYQNKSILDVAKNLLDSRGWDLKIVGLLVLCFSVLFPIIKLILSALYLQVEKLQANKMVKNMIFYLGKWSMADVFVVALFMTYIGFYGLVNSQLELIKHNKGGFAVETVNYTSLSSGALFFTTYCFLSIVIGIVINRMDAKKTLAKS